MNHDEQDFNDEIKHKQMTGELEVKLPVKPYERDKAVAEHIERYAELLVRKMA